MFRDQPGCLGVLLTLTGADSTTFSFWEDREAIEQLAISPSYQETVQRIKETGLLRGEQEVRIYPVFAGELDFANVQRMLK